MILAIAVISLICAAIPAVMFCRNMSVYSSAKPATDGAKNQPLVSVLIPARNEEYGIALTLQKVLSNDYSNIEVIVLDDDSTDATVEIVSKLIKADSRVRLEIAPELPIGWCGKQHACWILSQIASGDYFLFLDADVRLESDAISKTVSKYLADQPALLSCFPRQETKSIAEKLLIPLIHFILLGFLSIRTMRKNNSPSFAVGCGQFFFTAKEAYEKSGGHNELKESLHDGLRLPRAYRLAGLTTDVFDGTEIATVRMYRNASDVWSGLQKNAIEGLGNPRIIVPITSLLMLGHVVPFLASLIHCAQLLNQDAQPANNLLAASLFFIATVLSLLPRLIAAVWFKQSWIGAVMHPIGVSLLLIIQWTALFKYWRGLGGSWKGRIYSAATQHLGE